MDTPAPGPELTDYAATLRRRWWIIAAAMALGLTIAALALVVVPRTYTATTSVQVRPTGLADLTGERSGRTNGEVNLDTEAQLVASAEVASAALKKLGRVEDITEFRNRVNVSVPPNSSVLDIAYSDSGPELAQRGSTAFASAYLEYRAEQVDQQIDARVTALTSELRQREAALGRASDRADSATGAAQVRAETELGSVQNEITELGKQINPLKALRESLLPGQVITAAVAPDSASSPIPAMWLGSGLLLGLVAGVAAAYLLDRRDSRLRSVGDARRHGAGPVLLDLRATDAAAGILDATSRAGQGFQELAHTLGARLGAGDHVLQVSALSSGSSGAVVAVNLAAALARVDAGVLLVCADPGDATASRLLEAQGPGLTEVLIEGADTNALEQHPVRTPGLRLLSSGQDPDRAAGLLQREVMITTLNKLRGRARYVLVLTAPISERADAHAMAPACDAVLTVVELGRTRREDLTGGLDRLKHIGARMLGTVTVATLHASTPAPREQAPPVRAPKAATGAHDTAESSADLAPQR
ncbi:Wzz/FepE/Etk N-terminal domain-containing protein [Nocardiopsis ansamitocini]|uniref:Polysaccharide chain length determinant N-terminal domain-containing protein n=1 Tax=Nocardiopsis ansamitocini TaxID=1670832 RepID=A0A9W6UI01_9ACTN|nr:Wzz/FepE/Etk N-terminal domain-containing protein [Nocardiopsis ansamitocini]GLU46893.1 hypothetical protein Nans01_12440 [Nocardiopsis ansamitocini]